MLDPTILSVQKSPHTNSEVLSAAELNLEYIVPLHMSYDSVFKIRELLLLHGPVTISQIDL